MKAHLWKRVAVAVALLALMAAALPPLFSGGPPAHAATMTVTKTADTNDGVCDADCSLREAIGAANALSGADTIVVPAGTYTLSIPGSDEDANATGDLDITADLTINGLGAATTIIDGADLDRVFHVDPDAAGVTVELSGLTIQNGSCDGGGGIYNSGTLTLTSSTVSDNTASGGGGIVNVGALTLTDSTVSGNTSGSDGGGIANGGTLEINSSTVSDNTAGGSAGGIDNYDTLTLTGSSTVIGNTAGGDAGGIANYYTLTLTGSTVSGNTAGDRAGGIANYYTLTLTSSTVNDNTASVVGGILNDGTLTLTDSTVSGNTAAAYIGGIYNDGGLTLTDSTVGDNNASDIGGIYNDGTLTLTDSTVGGNTAILSNGGIYNIGTLAISNSTVSDNSAGEFNGGIYNGGTLTLTDTTVSGNTAALHNGGIWNEGIVTFSNSTVRGNTAALNNGGIGNSGTLTVIDTAVSENTANIAAGIGNAPGGTLTLSNSTVSDNTATGCCGGIGNDVGGTLEINSTTISGNTAVDSGGIYNAGSLTLNSSIISNNIASSGRAGGIGNGGAITINGATVTGNTATLDAGGIGNDIGGTLEINSSTISGNTALTQSGGGIGNAGTATLTNVTASGNWAAQYAGGVGNNGGSLTINSSTITGNTATLGGGVSNRPGSMADLKNTVVANNAAGDCDGTITSTGHNLDGDNTCNLTAAGDLPGVNPLLGPLAENGGPTQTHALLPGSRAIDAGSPDCPPPYTDQRGVVRPQGAACDIGAFELVGDSDGDGVLDVDDACPVTPGLPDRQGCPVGDANTVTLHVVDQAKSGACPGGAGSCKSPVAGAEVRVFDRNDGAFQAAYGGKNPNGSLYGTIFEAGTAQIAGCTTDASGQCTAGEETTGDYLAIVKYVDSGTGKTVYTGKPKSPEDFVDGVATKEFQILKVIRKDGSVQYSGGSKTVVSGSYLEIVYPEFAVWEDVAAGYVYPFIFTSDSDWGVDVCAYVAKGYAIVGVYDENGTLISDSRCTQTFVTGETKVVAYEVVDVGSPEPKLDARLKVKHQGKATTLDLSVPGIRKAKGGAPKGPLAGDLVPVAPVVAMSFLGVGLWGVRSRLRTR